MEAREGGECSANALLRLGWGNRDRHVGYTEGAWESWGIARTAVAIGVERGSSGIAIEVLVTFKEAREGGECSASTLCRLVPEGEGGHRSCGYGERR